MSSTSRPERASSPPSSSAADSASPASTRARRCSRARESGSAQQVELVEASAEALPFADAAFRPPHRHVPPPLRRRSGRDARRARARRPPGRRRGLARVRRARPGSRARLGALRPRRPPARRPRRCGTAGARSVTSSEGRSARTGSAYPLERQLELWPAAGIEDVDVRRMSLGGGVVMWGRRR